MTQRILVPVILLMLVCPPLMGQNSPDNPLTPDEKAAVIEAVCQQLEAEYIFPDITQRYVRELQENLRSGRYDGIDDPPGFAEAITGDLAEVHEDRHLRIRFDPQWVSNEKSREELDPVAVERSQWWARTTNYGFEEIEILPGNVGYLKLNSFSYEPQAYDVAIGALRVLANADALIIDLQSNGGGSPEMVQFLCSYFLANPRKHLNSFTYRDPEKLTQYWTYTYLPGPRLDEVELFVLTSENTFSAAEEFAYNLKNLERAVIVGETTGGGAHDNKFVMLTDRFMMSLPFARAVNPVTQANWEGTGVAPDVAVPRDSALAHALALAGRALAEQDGPAFAQAFHAWYRDLYESALSPVSLDAEALHEFVGTYGPRQITLDNGELYYQRGERAEMKMIPMGHDLFRFDENSTFRVRFVREGAQVVAIEGLNPDGSTDRHDKD